MHRRHRMLLSNDFAEMNYGAFEIKIPAFGRD